MVNVAELVNVDFVTQLIVQKRHIRAFTGSVFDMVAPQFLTGPINAGHSAGGRILGDVMRQTGNIKRAGCIGPKHGLNLFLQTLERDLDICGYKVDNRFGAGILLFVNPEPSQTIADIPHEERRGCQVVGINLREHMTTTE